jgi:hypothetical protein
MIIIIGPGFKVCSTIRDFSSAGHARSVQRRFLFLK